MNKPFTAVQVAQGIRHIWDPMGVGMTLLEGSERALLFDAGYGLWDLKPVLKSVNGKPLTLLLSHVHHDHMLGALRLETEVFIHPADMSLKDRYSAAQRRQDIVASAREKDLSPDVWANEHYLRAQMPPFLPLETDSFQLGGLSVRVLHLPGHTPGSIGLMVEQRGVLLLADCWNPQTWVFFPECCSISRYRQSMQSLTKLPFEQVVVSHDPLPRRAEGLLQFISGLNDEVLDGAVPYAMAGYEGISTHRCEPCDGSPFIFDGDKWARTKSSAVSRSAPL